MVEVSDYRTHVRLYNVDVTICEDGRIYIDNPNGSPGQYFNFKTSEISRDELGEMCEEIENKWNKGEGDDECDC